MISVNYLCFWKCFLHFHRNCKNTIQGLTLSSFLFSFYFLSSPFPLRPSLQALWSGAMGGERGRAGKADGDFWIGLTREGGANQTQSDLSSLAFCSQLYYWTDGSAASFRYCGVPLHQVTLAVCNHCDHGTGTGILMSLPVGARPA